MNDSSIHKITEDHMYAVYKDMGKNESTIGNLIQELNRLKEKIEQLQREMLEIRLAVEGQKVKLMFYGVIGGTVTTFAISLLQSYITKGQ